MTSLTPPLEPSSPLNLLPFDVRCVIVESLPCVDAALSTFISRDWAHVWETKPFLAIHEGCFRDHPFCADKVFKDFMTWLFRSHSSHTLRHLFLEVLNSYDQQVLSNWFSGLNPSRLKSIDLSLKNSPVPLPLITTSRFYALERLFLQEVDLSFPTRTSLRLPSLLSIRIFDCIFQSEVTFSIETPLLKTFAYMDPPVVEWHAAILEIDAPELDFVLMNNGVRGRRFHFASRCTVLEEALVNSFLDSTYDPDNSDDYRLSAFILLQDFSSVSILDLSPHLLQILVDANWGSLTFSNLERMSVIVWETYGCFQTLLNFLSRCPRIKNLKLEFDEVDEQFDEDQFGLFVGYEEFDLPPEGIWAPSKSLNLVAAANPNLGKRFTQFLTQFLAQMDLLAEGAAGYVSQ